LMEAQKSGMDVIIKEGLANGRALSNPKLLKLSSTLNCQPWRSSSEVKMRSIKEVLARNDRLTM
jgi:hypothetical protein